jgi:hypothetical protein
MNSKPIYVMIPVIHEGREKPTPIFVDQVAFLLRIPVPTGLAAPGGDKQIIKTGTGIGVGGTVLVSRLTNEEVLKLLGAENNENND